MPAPIEVPPRPKNAPQLLRGMKDILPPEQPWFQAVLSAAERAAVNSGFQRIDTPVVEQEGLFNRVVGTETDIVSKEMYMFLDRGGDKVALRPEGTAGVVRAYLEHGLVSWPQPVKMWYVGPMFRYDRPQAGRYRQHWQVGYEVIGDANPVIDAQLIVMATNFFHGLGLPVTVQINSLGDSQCRPAYIKALTDYYKTRKNGLCETCKKRLVSSPLRLLDCKELDCQELAREAPQIVDHLCEPCRQHFVTVLEYLDDIEVPYSLAPKLVRGQDYYTRTTFEFIPEGATGSQSAVGGGGRFDKLVEQLGGQPTPAGGFSLGVERIMTALHERNVPVPELRRPDVFLAQLGLEARKKCMRLFQAFQREGIVVSEAFSKDGLKQQLEVANRLKAAFTLIIGQKELMDDTILIRDMENGIQEIVDFKKVVGEVKKRLAKLPSTSTTTHFTPAPSTEPPAPAEPLRGTSMTGPDEPPSDME